MDESRLRIVTGEVRLAYCNVWNPKPNHTSGSGALKYSAQLIIPKTSRKTVAAILDGIDAAIDQGVEQGIWKIKPSLDKVKHPLRDGDADRPEDPNYWGCWFVNANTTVRPRIVGLDNKPLTNPGEMYSGVYARVVLTFVPFPHVGGCISAILGNIQKLADGDSMCKNCSNPADDFRTEVLDTWPSTM